MTLVLLSILFIFFGLFSKKLEKSLFSAPVVFTAAGLLLGTVGLDWVNIQLENQRTRLIAELTLALVLFSDASRIHLQQVKRDHNLPIRLLLIGLPIMIVLGAFVAKLIFPLFTLLDCFVLSAILAPTDAALIHSVLNHSKAPFRMRQALNIESGLNDGLVVPVITLLFSFYSVIGEAKPLKEWVFFLIQHIGLGILVGCAVGYFGGKLCILVRQKKWMNHTFEEIAAVAIALFSYSFSELIFANGFIAAFVAGTMVGSFAKGMCKSIQDFASTEGQLLTLLLFFIFGASFIYPLLMSFHWNILFYSLLSLTFIRFIPVALSLIGCHLKLESIVYISWFGPRGLASIVFGLLVLENSRIFQGKEIFHIASATILLSIFLHGFTAIPASIWYAKKVRQRAKSEEYKKVSNIPVRHSPGA